MSHIVTIIVETGQENNLQKACKLLQEALPNADCLERDARLARFCVDDEADAIKKAISNIPHRRFDYAIRPIKAPKPKLFMADMDSTMITVECIDELADALGIKEKVSTITEAAMRGELDFKSSLKERVNLLKGLNESRLSEIYEERIRPSKGAEKLIETLKRNNIYTVLVSGGFTFFAERVARDLGFDAFHANRLEIREGLLTGKVLPPILDANTKQEIRDALCTTLGIRLEETVIAGDGANDILMMENAGFSVSHFGKTAIEQAADATIRHTDLGAIAKFLCLS